MKLRIFGAVVFAAFVASPLAAADQTWTGQISDAMCGKDHAAMQKGGKKMSDKECTLACAKADDSYVLVSGGKVYKLANAKATNVQQFAGDKVQVAGSAKGDTITISKIEAAK